MQSEHTVSKYGMILDIMNSSILIVGRVAQSAHRMATGWKVRDRIPVEARFSATVQTGPGAHPAFCTMGTGSFPGVESGLGVTLIPHPFYCRGQEKVELYLYSPYGPYGLYRALVPVQYSYTSTPLSACTRVHFILPSVPVQWSYTATPPMGRTACTEPQCLYKGALYLTLSACTVELYRYSPYGPYSLYRASVPVQGCTLPYPQCLYKGALYLLPFL